MRYDPDETVRVVVHCDGCDGWTQIRAHVTMLGRHQVAIDEVHEAPEGWQVNAGVRRCPLHADWSAEAA